MSRRTFDSGRSVDILLVEDNPGDVRLIKEVFKEVSLANPLHVVTDGEEAIDFVRQRGEHTDAPRPDLVLLDWNLPLKGGEEVLDEIKGTDSLSTIPVVVVTGSQAQEDVARSYELQANAYVTKPVEPDRFLDIINSVQDYWLNIVRLPPEDGDT